MAAEVVLQGDGIEPRKISVADAIASILPRGHVIHGYSSASSTRMLMVLESRDYSDDAPLLGFGMDGSAERALARSLITYALREQMGLQYITEGQLPESREGQAMFGRNVSKFDRIIWGGDFKMYQDGEDIVAESGYGGGWGMDPLEVRARDPLAAIVLLAETYQFMGAGRRDNPPALSIE